MKQVLGIDFSPLADPFDEKLFTLGVLAHFVLAIPFTMFCFLLPFILIFTFQWHILLAYSLWYLYDRKSPQNGGYRVNFPQRWRIQKWFANYFPITLHKTAELPTDRNYIVACHPHGIIGMAVTSNFASEGTDKSKVFPGIRFSVCTLASNFQVMFTREFLLLCGLIDCSKESIANALTEQKTGRAIVLAVGGAEEALEARPGAHKLKLLTRKGFVEQATRNGASLVPVYSFGENDLYNQLDNPEGSLVRKIQTLSKRWLGISLPLFYGRGVLQLNFGFLPHRRPIHTVVGAPIAVPKIPEPTDEEVDHVHRQYCKALEELFEQHKTRYGVSKDAKLILV
uniref:Acyltransferase n=1 Tax=Haemonchus contortus TaxID=6289 RepID=A0A7I5E677_HAECO